MVVKKNLSQMAECLALELGIDPKSTRVVLKCFLQMVKGDLHNGVTVTLSGFGSFRPCQREARRVRNPRVASGPGAYKNVEAMIAYRFKPGTDLRPGTEGKVKDKLSANDLLSLQRLK